MRKPIKLLGEIHRPIWSGHRLCEIYAAFADYGTVGEAWMTSPDSIAVTDNGNLPFGEYLEGLGLPTPPLVKLIDAASPLSIQVHPDNEAAKILGGISKNEIWYVLHAEDGAEILYGTVPDVSISALRDSVLNGDPEPYLNKIPVQAGDIFPIPSGMIHSLGGGITVLEVQDRAGTTYRVKDISGNREIHSAESANSVRIISREDAFRDFNSSENIIPGKSIISAEAFTVSRYTAVQSDSFLLDHGGVYLFCNSGSGYICDIPFTEGDSLFVPDMGAAVSLFPQSSVILVK